MCKYTPLKTAVFPVAGMGTRFLPATKDVPKEMLPLLDKPLIHHGVEEVVNSGCKEVVFVTGEGKESIEKYFSHSIHLEETLRENGKDELLAKVEAIPEMAKFHFTIQEKPLGLGHAVLCAEKFCEDDFFALLLPDDVFKADLPVISQLDNVRKKYGRSVLMLEEVSPSETSRYGIVDAEEIEPGVFKINGLVEKPKPEEAPSNLAIMGRYILSSGIFKHLKQIKRGAGGEYQLTDAIASMLREEPVYACLYDGNRYDCGVTEGWIKSTVKTALRDSRYRNCVLDALHEEGIIE